MKGSLVSLLAGWALITAFAAALTTPWVWALGAGIPLVAYGAVGLVAAVRVRQDTLAKAETTKEGA